MQVGGGALASLAVMGDPGTDPRKIVALLEESEKAMIRTVTEGFGDGGYFAEGDGTGSMASHIVYLTALQAWKNAAGKDFISPRPNASWTALKWFLLTIPQGSDRSNLSKGFVGRGGYPHNLWARDGISGGSYFSIGYEAVTKEQLPGLWWFYHHYMKAWDDENGVPWDTVSPYPHQAILAFVNTPFGLAPRDPAECMPLSDSWPKVRCRLRGLKATKWSLARKPFHCGTESWCSASSRVCNAHRPRSCQVLDRDDAMGARAARLARTRGIVCGGESSGCRAGRISPEEKPIGGGGSGGSSTGKERLARVPDSLHHFPSRQSRTIFARIWG